MTAHPEWRRGNAPALFAEESYLRDWEAPDRAGEALLPDQPVVHVSWFAATAYCESQGARLPTWHEWEWAAAADERVADARRDAEWRQRILGWYAQTGGSGPRRVAQGKPNFHGVHDLQPVTRRPSIVLAAALAWRGPCRPPMRRRTRSTSSIPR